MPPIECPIGFVGYRLVFLLGGLFTLHRNLYRFHLALLFCLELSLVWAFTAYPQLFFALRCLRCCESIVLEIFLFPPCSALRERTRGLYEEKVGGNRRVLPEWLRLILDIANPLSDRHSNALLKLPNLGSHPFTCHFRWLDNI